MNFRSFFSLLFLSKDFERRNNMVESLGEEGRIKKQIWTHSVEFLKSRSETYCHAEQKTFQMFLVEYANKMQICKYITIKCFHRKACTCFSWFLPLVSITDKSYFSMKVLRTGLAAVRSCKGRGIFLRRERGLISISTHFVRISNSFLGLGVASQRRRHWTVFSATNH